MKKFDDTDLWTLFRLTPLIFLTYFQFLSWQTGETWALVQWLSIILANIALIIFLMDLFDIIHIQNGTLKPLINWCMLSLFLYHIARIIIEVLKLII